MKEKPSNPWGCYDRPPRPTSMMAQDGWIDIGLNGWPVRIPRMVRISTPWGDECKHEGRFGDPRCINCKHQS